MKAIWSFWAKPFLEHYHKTWGSSVNFLYSWVISLENAKRFYSRTELYTDDEGKELLIDKLGLEFSEVYTSLNELKDHNADFWATGKLHTYRQQEEPFIHLDNDVFLWKQLPERLHNAEVIVQNPEYFEYGSPHTCYQPGKVNMSINAAKGWMPEEWKWYTKMQGGKALNCGIFGGNRLDFIKYYADTAIRFIEDSKNEKAWKYYSRDLNQKINCNNHLFEQYMLGAVIEFHNNVPEKTKFPNVVVEPLFYLEQDAYNNDITKNLGYTHLIGEIKRHNVVMQRMESRIRNDHPAFYTKCRDLFV